MRQKGSGIVAPKLKFDGPIRYVIEVQTQSPAAARPQIRIHEFATKPADEVISSSDYQWRNGGAIYTTQKVYSKLPRFRCVVWVLKIHGLISTLDFTTEDHTLFMPLWAGVPDQQRAQTLLDAPCWMQTDSTAHLESLPSRLCPSLRRIRFASRSPALELVDL
jgi:hypothetical protein